MLWFLCTCVTIFIALALILMGGAITVLFIQKILEESDVLDEEGDEE